jgi:hypothetical protein
MSDEKQRRATPSQPEGWDDFEARHRGAEDGHPARSDQAPSPAAGVDGWDSLDELLAGRLRRVELEPERRARMLQALAAAQAASPAAAIPPVPATCDDRGRQAVRLRERWGWAAVGLSALAACLFVAVWFILPTKWDRIGPRQLAEWAQSDWQPTGKWRPFQFRDTQVARPLSKFLRVVPRRFQLLETHLDPQAAVFELATSADKAPSRLFALCVGRRIPSLSNRPPQQPQTGQDGQFVAAWQEADCVYVVTVPGPPRNYWEIVRVPGASLARTPAGTRSG